MRTIMAVGPAAILLTVAAPATAQHATSAYTPLNTNRCQVLSRIVEGESISWRCPGRDGIALYVNSGDGRYELDAGVADDEWRSIPAFNQIGNTVEWRLRGGRPFAVIYRLTSVDPATDPNSMLIVETIGRAGRPGCEVGRVNALRADANARARAEADLRAGAFRCGRDQPSEIGR
jgi:hypothetical protein